VAAFEEHAAFIARERDAAVQEQRRAASEIAVAELTEIEDDDSSH
jgi:hypothetical protein